MSHDLTKKRPVRPSAVVGIVVWSLVFCLLGGLLLAGLWGAEINLRFFELPGGVHLNLGGFTYEDAGEYSVGDASVKAAVTELEINWLEGDVTVIPSETDQISVSENYNGEDDDLRLRWRVEDGKLTVQYRKSTWLGTSRSVRKDLTVAIPAAMLEAMDEVEITTVSGGVSYTGNADELTLDAVAGDFTVNGDIGELEMHAVQGKITFTGSVRTAEVECVDTAVTMNLHMAASLSFDQVDGDVVLYLSDEIKGFSAEVEALGGEITADGFDGMKNMNDENARWGDGSLRVRVEGVGAKLNIKKLTND